MFCPTFDFNNTVKTKEMWYGSLRQTNLVYKRFLIYIRFFTRHLQGLSTGFWYKIIQKVNQVVKIFKMELH